MKAVILAGDYGTRISEASISETKTNESCEKIDGIFKRDGTKECGIIVGEIL